MTGQSVGIAFKRIAKALNPPDLDPGTVSSHSARIGATHDLLEDGASGASKMRDGGWKTSRVVAMYSRAANAKRGAMASQLATIAGLIAQSRDYPSDVSSGTEDDPATGNNKAAVAD